MSALDSLLAPASVAVVGASDNPHKVGGRPLRYLLDQGYAGRIYAVNPRQRSVQGLPAFAGLDALPEVPDVAVLCVAAEQAEEQLELAARLGVRHALLFASGYAEVGAEGAAREQRLLAIARSGGLRLLGPNSIGVASFDSGAVLSFASIYTDHAPADGAVAIVSQSGAFGVSAYALLREQGIGVRCVAATGNEADLCCADFVDALARRPGVRLLLLYLEDVQDAALMRRALETARAHGVAVLAVRAARSTEGRRSARWHTGSEGAADARLDAMFAAAGCRTVAHLGELVASVPLYLDPAARSPATPPRIAIVSNSGASCVLAADAADRLGLPLAELGAGTRAMLDASLPPFSLNRNPIDLTAMLLADASLLGRVMTGVLADPGVDAALLGLLAIGGPSYDVPRFAREARQAALAAGRPLALYSPHAHVRATFAREGVAVYTHEAEALQALAEHAAHRRALQPAGVAQEELHNA
ncbi:CoA-binding protein [Piscinibacter sp. HJYY11]|uniref:CoA-binding protein n=1 Tax=Piscinibacter sp. HJYY11 TaxID=2801333 RepID=UPI00191D69BC|nr:CoA-binding protein [Piscinibacter sp. HJYY11]MBL0730669.1 CoA-binding protein [Piscinibacter sp. HJYY11]